MVSPTSPNFLVCRNSLSCIAAYLSMAYSLSCIVAYLPLSYSLSVSQLMSSSRIGCLVCQLISPCRIVCPISQIILQVVQSILYRSSSLHCVQFVLYCSLSLHGVQFVLYCSLPRLTNSNITAGIRAMLPQICLPNKIHNKVTYMKRALEFRIELHKYIAALSGLRKQQRGECSASCCIKYNAVKIEKMGHCTFFIRSV